MPVHDLAELGTYLHSALHSSAAAAWTHADVLLERSVHTTVRWADARVTDSSRTTDAGAAVRALSGGAVRYGCVDRLSREGIGQALTRIGAAPRLPAYACPWIRESEETTAHGVQALTDLLARIDLGARATDPRVEHVLVDAESVTRSLAVGRLDGEPAFDERHLLYLTIQVVARQGDRWATGFYTPATSRPDAWDLDPHTLGREAAERAIASLAARPAPAVRAPVVVAGGRGMVLIHEACCHPLEADEVLRGSIYAGRIGEQVASPLLTLIDDPTVPGAVGSMTIDDEGGPAAPTTLVEQGRLASFLVDEVSALRLGTAATGNGRRSDHRHPVLPRMTNTVVAAGTTDPADIIADTAYGIWAQHVAGGEVTEATGDFVFRVTNGYLIENGRITDPIEETTVCGNGHRVLRDIDAVGDDVTLGAAKCGKHGQLVPVGVQGPTLRVRELLIGGTAV